VSLNGAIGVNVPVNDSLTVEVVKGGRELCNPEANGVFLQTAISFKVDYQEG
jgi:hypothetical protein